jgi:nitroimidazol reductase NimA-like FMN-containing flavoprotein (pyridoxamine 5'-phosphate oxidase superfamily)
MPWPETYKYPQKPPLTEEEMASFLEETLFARLGTLNEDGTIHITPVYFRYDNGQIIIATQDISRKVKNIKHNNNVTVLVDVTPWPFKGVLIYGTAELDCDDVIEKRVTIFERDRPHEEAQRYAQRLSNTWKCVIVRVTPTHIVTFDYTKD